MNIYVTRLIPEDGIKMLQDAFGVENVEINPDDRVLTRAELLEKVKGRDGIVCLLTDTIDSEVMDAAGPLNFIHIHKYVFVKAINFIVIFFVC